eukprot:TRINITY_DN66422_c1_g1_i1.p1 TRINITY_DN66422_c1_g1~~TRINITY_DN66422_c1_g1_i1.p1  ORF type:complete len:596 (+),score=305.89 TRINITY_DN66422_c1_g1_i1:106-1893(+)
MGCASSGLSEKEKVAVLRHTPLFRLSEDDMRSFASVLKAVHYQAAERVCSYGEEASTFFVIGEGEVDITAVDKSGEDVFLCTKKKGDFFGDQALFEADHKRNANVTCTVACTLLVLERERWLKFARAHPGFQKKIEEIVGQQMTNLLKRIPFLADLSEWTRQLLASMFEYVPVAAGERVFNQGDIGKELYIISAGTVEVLARQGEESEEVSIAKLGPGSYFGEIALMVDMPRTAGVQAVDDCLLLSLKKQDFHNFMSLVPEFRDSFDGVVKQRTAEFFKKFNVPFFEAIPNELYAQLSALCEIEEFPANSVIFHEGDPGLKFYIIVFGTAHVTVLDRDKGKTIPLCSMGPGRYFGEVALLKECERTATVTTDSRCVMLSIEKTRFHEFFKQHPESFADFEIKLSRYDVPFETVLHHRLGIRFLTKHLQNEYSEENILFWKDVQKFKAIGTDPRLRAARVRAAKNIVANYVSNSAPNQVNISSEQQERIVAHLKGVEIDGDELHDAPIDIFDEGEQEIVKLMAKDSFKRFKATNLFKEFLQRIDAYSHADIRPSQSQELHRLLDDDRPANRKATQVSVSDSEDAADQDDVKLDVES